MNSMSINKQKVFLDSQGYHNNKYIPNLLAEF